VGFALGDQAAIAARPRESALDDPAATQQLETTLVIGAFDDFQLDRQPDELARELGSGIAAILDQTGGAVAIADIARN